MDLGDLKAALRRSKLEVAFRGHDWDVADVMEVLGMSGVVPLTYERFIETIEEAVERGWASPIVCATHDGVPHTEDEQADWEDGFDPCAPAIRLWEPEPSG